MSYKDKEAQREYQREWIKRRKSQYLDGKSCVKCGSVDNLNFHHIDPKEKTDHRIWSWNLNRLEDELEKCIILCVKCHQRFHYGESKHGTWRRYKVYKCRCDLCRKHNADHERNRRAKSNLGLESSLG